MKIAIAGATGFIGRRLVEALHRDGHSLLLLVRDRRRAERLFPAAFFPRVQCMEDNGQPGLDGIDGVINLAGEPIAGSAWSDQVKTKIKDSRVQVTQNLVAAIANAQPRPQFLINGSAIGFYGTSLTKVFDEYSFGGEDFLAQVCQAWETAADRATELGVRVIKLRTGLVLGAGGILERLLPIFKLGLGGQLGSGKQWFSWIDRDDLVAMIQFLIDKPDLSGVFNGTAPQPVTNAEFTKILAEVLERPALLPVPDFVLQIALGEAAMLALEGQKVLPQKAQLAGFKFAYPELKNCLVRILK
ncbi:MAG: TIGR01777 family oxidoreductase [Pseudanabaenaceae cyanobacterium bins.68]|nr:TIGR01777 family oxidoreductase [Pseudanabaenaceae cyanobacterium bins.68]